MKAINEQRYYCARQSVFSRALLPSEVVLEVESWITYDPKACPSADDPCVRAELHEDIARPAC